MSEKDKEVIGKGEMTSSLAQIVDGIVESEAAGAETNTVMAKENGVTSIPVVSRDVDAAIESKAEEEETMDVEAEKNKAVDGTGAKRSLDLLRPSKDLVVRRVAGPVALGARRRRPGSPVSWRSEEVVVDVGELDRAKGGGDGGSRDWTIRSDCAAGPEDRARRCAGGGAVAGQGASGEKEQRRRRMRESWSSLILSRHLGRALSCGACLREDRGEGLSLRRS
ncbi:uncharacterized protein A4U43_C07F1230 [Asparagus officinalis]|uniref:Uncharacterized protein n=1 Tax=Asparagus officinalis TaxID=4686 RepID=A0A5P1E8L7_ASPOF|nr:uncharacterized protein A4U43_C07F1230 [Asparagus officinalis]